MSQWAEIDRIKLQIKNAQICQTSFQKTKATYRVKSHFIKEKMM